MSDLCCLYCPFSGCLGSTTCSRDRTLTFDTPISE
jgi:hypothetical protein